MGLIHYNAQPGTSNAALFTSAPVAPAGLAVAAVGSGGTFAAATYYWKITFLNANSVETGGSNEATVAIVSNGSANLTWTTPPAGTTGVKVYRGTAAGAENVLVATLGVVAAYTDTGTGSVATTPGAPPAGSRAVTPLKKIVAINATAAAVTLTLTVVRAISGAIENVTTPPGAVIAASSAYSLVEDRLLALDEIVLEPGDALWGFASTGSAVTVVAFE